MFWQILIAWIFIIDWIVKILWKVFLKYHIILAYPPIDFVLFVVLALGLFHLTGFHYLGSKVALVVGYGPLDSDVF